jgi:hypothetical protein
MAVDADEAHRRVDEVAGSGRTTLDLSKLRLTELPPRVAELHNLTEPRLDENRLTGLPHRLGELTAPDDTSPARQQVHRVPDSLGNLVASPSSPCGTAAWTRCRTGWAT